ncbi:MAG: LPS export ABC transporter periplasmic protein LptC [Xanthomonadaceae bacterium]|nr:LPS export ABC transporter periplasmic protein LptC [Xanthomonadaceae bacterium]
MNWRWISISALLAALVIGYGALNRRDTTLQVIAEAPLRPAYYLRNAVITETSPDGTMETQLAAARIELEPLSDELTMSEVFLTYFQSPEQEWRLTADRGYKPGTSPIFRLIGDVELRPAKNDTDASLRAEELAIDTEKEVAFSTRSPVQIRFGNHSMEVQRFRFDLNEQKLHLEAGEGRYAQL